MHPGSRTSIAGVRRSSTAAIESFWPRFNRRCTVKLAAGIDLCCYHGSPRSYDEVIVATTPDDELEMMMAGFAGRVFAGGHTHARMLRTLRGCEILNPGSVGLAYQSLPDGRVRVPSWAEYAWLTVNNGAVSVDFRRVPYDQDATIRAMFQRGMPHAGWWSEDWR